MKVLKEEELTGGETTVRVDGARKAVNPRYVVEAVAVQLGLKPSQCAYLWPHYVAMVRRLPLVPCIRCGAASESDFVCDIEGPHFLINRTRSVNREVATAFRIAQDHIGSVAYTKESELMIFNGFCEACLSEIEDKLPPIMKLGVPEDESIKTVRTLVAKALRQGHVSEMIRALRKLVDPPDGSIF